jgi:hypothetical protein
MADSGIILNRAQAGSIAEIVSARVLDVIRSGNPIVAEMAEGVIGGQLDGKLDEIFAGKEQVSLEELQAGLDSAVAVANDTGVVNISSGSVLITVEDLENVGVEKEKLQSLNIEGLEREGDYIIPEAPEEKGFFGRLMEAFKVLISEGGGIMAAFAVLFGGEEEKGIAVADKNAALDVNRDEIIDIKDLNAMDLDKDGKLQESEIDQVVGDNKELRNELASAMKDLGVQFRGDTTEATTQHTPQEQGTGQSQGRGE